MSSPKLFPCLLWLAATMTCQAQWLEKNNGLFGGSIQALSVNGANVYALVSAESDTRMFKSTSDGAVWTLSNTGLPRRPHKVILSNGSDIFVGGERGIFRSQDEGATWADVSTGLTFSFQANQVGSMATSNGNLFATIDGDGIFRSTNNGDSWTKLPLTTNRATAVFAMGTTVLVGTTDGLFRSTTSGGDLTALNVGISQMEVHAFAVIGSQIFAATNKGLLSSTNGGGVWVVTNSAGFESLQVVGTKLYATPIDGSQGVVSTNLGVSFTNISSTVKSASSMIVQKGTKLLYGTGVGVYSADLTGVNWTSLNYGITGVTVNSMKTVNSILLAGTGSGVFKSVDNGATWGLLCLASPLLIWK